MIKKIKYTALTVFTVAAISLPIHTYSPLPAFAEDEIVTDKSVATAENIKPAIKYVLDDSERLADFPTDGRVEEHAPSEQIKEPLSELTIFVGDSRTVGIENLRLDENIYIAKVGAGYEWFSDTAIPNLKDTIAQNSDKKISVVVAMGVNDPDNAYSYISKVNNLSTECPSADFYYLSVNPVEGGSITNEDIRNFNYAAMESLNSDVTFIDTYSYLISDGFNTVDGIHYADSTYKKIYDYVNSSIA